MPEERRASNSNSDCDLEGIPINDSWWEKHSHAQHILSLMHAQGFDVTRWKATIEKDPSESKLSVLENLIAEFYIFPIHKQRQILNGWAPCRWIPSTADWFSQLQRCCESSPSRFLNLYIDPRRGDLHWDHEYEIEGTEANFFVRIREGASGEEVMHAIDRLKYELTEKWEKAIDDLPLVTKMVRRDSPRDITVAAPKVGKPSRRGEPAPGDFIVDDGPVIGRVHAVHDKVVVYEPLWPYSAPCGVGTGPATSRYVAGYWTGDPSDIETLNARTLTDAVVEWKRIERESHTYGPDMLFEDVNGKPVPRIALDENGERRNADGVKYFDLAGAALHFHRLVEDLEADWNTYYADLMPAPKAVANG